MSEQGAAQVAEGKQAGTLIQSVSRASAIMMAVAESDAGVSARDVAERVGINAATAHNLLRTLLHEGLLEKAPGPAYVLGPAARVLAAAASRLRRPPQAFHEALTGLAAETGETAYLGAWSGDQISLVESVESMHTLRLVPRPLGPEMDTINARATAKILLAYCPEDVKDSVLDRCAFPALTPATIVTRAAFEAELVRVRAAGVAYDREEYLQGASCVSAPIWVGSAVPACLSLHVPQSRFAGQFERLTEATVRYAEQASVRSTR
ncbi:IclR family transcriptional regulator [Rarobacter incanus]|nr:IclR family transcriptional regulator [Rarobacter incanus]